MTVTGDKKHLISLEKIFGELLVLDLRTVPYLYIIGKKNLLELKSFKLFLKKLVIVDGKFLISICTGINVIN